MMRSGKRKLHLLARGYPARGLEHLEQRDVLSGLSLFDAQYWHQSLPGVLDIAEDGDLYAAAIATGDFNNDDHMDLAVGVPGESLAGVSGVGAVSGVASRVAKLSGKHHS